MGHTSLQIVYYLIVRGESYHELGSDDLARRNATGRIRYLKRELEKLTVRGTIEPLALAA